MIVKLSACTPLCRAWSSPSTSVDVRYILSRQPQTDEQKQPKCSHVGHKRPNASSKGAPTPATNDRMPAEKALPRWPQTTEYQLRRRFHAGLKRPNTSSKDASHVGLKRPNTSSKGAPTSVSNDRMPAAKIMIFTKRHNKMPKKPPPEEKESLQAKVRLQASLMIKPVWSWSIKPLRESQQLPQREPL